MSTNEALVAPEKEKVPESDAQPAEKKVLWISRVANRVDHKLSEKSIGKGRVTGRARSQNAPPPMSPAIMLKEAEELAPLLAELEEWDEDKAKGLREQVEKAKAMANGRQVARGQLILETVKQQLETLPPARKREAEKKRQEKNADLAHDLGKHFKEVQRVTLSPGSDKLLAADVKLDDHFGQVVTTVKALETDRSPENLKKLETACNNWLNRYAGLDPKLQKSPDELKKHGRVMRTLRDMRFNALAAEFGALGDPPWDLEQETKAKQLQTEYYFMEGALHSPDGSYGAKALGGEGGVNAAWWVERSGTFGGDTKGSRMFIFKPAELEEDFGKGWDPGAGAIREVAAKTVSDQITRSTGIDFGVCETSLVAIDGRNLAGYPGGEMGGKHVGAMQQLARNDGDTFALTSRQGDQALSRIPAKEVHGVMVLDMLLMNYDRHSGNTLVREEGKDGPVHLTPIDHGKSMPSKTAFLDGRREMLTQHFFLTHNAPQVDEPFSEEMLDQLSRLDPDGLADSLRETRRTLVELHPDMADKLADETIEMSRRSAMFVKAGAAAGLTPREMMQAYMTLLPKVFGAKPEDLERAVKEAVETAQKRREASKELSEFTEKQLIALLKELAWNVDDVEEGRDHGNQFLPNWIRDEPDRIAKTVKARLPNPAVVKRTAVLEREIKQLDPKQPEFEPKNFVWRERFNKIRDLHRRLYAERAEALGVEDKSSSGLAALRKLLEQDKDVSADNVEEKLAAMLEHEVNSLDKELLDDFDAHFKRPSKSAALLEDVGYWREFKALGGIEELERLGQLYERSKNVKDLLNQLRDLKSREEVEGLDVNVARKDALENQVRVLTTHTQASDSPQKAAALKLIEGKVGAIRDLGNAAKFDEAERIIRELENEVERVLQGEDSRVAKLEARIMAAMREPSRLRDETRKGEMTKRWGYVHALYAEYQFDRCETMLARFEDDVHSMLREQRFERERAESGAESRISKLDLQLEELQKQMLAAQKIVKPETFARVSKLYWQIDGLKKKYDLDACDRELVRLNAELQAVRGIEDAKKKLGSLSLEDVLASQQLTDAAKNCLIRIDQFDTYPDLMKLYGDLTRMTGDSAALTKFYNERVATGAMDKRIPEKYRRQMAQWAAANDWRKFSVHDAIGDIEKKLRDVFQLPEVREGIATWLG